MNRIPAGPVFFNRRARAAEEENLGCEKLFGIGGR
jgi:hypothetical protein